MTAKIKIELVESESGVNWKITAPINSTPEQTVAAVKAIMQNKFPSLNVVSSIDAEELIISFVVNHDDQMLVDMQSLFDSINDALQAIYFDVYDMPEISVFLNGVPKKPNVAETSNQMSPAEKNFQYCFERVGRSISVIYISEDRCDLELRVVVKLQHHDLQNLISYINTTLKEMKATYGMEGARSFIVTPDFEVKALWKNIRFADFGGLPAPKAFETLLREAVCKLFMADFDKEERRQAAKANVRTRPRSGYSQ